MEGSNGIGGAGGSYQQEGQEGERGLGVSFLLAGRPMKVY